MERCVSNVLDNSLNHWWRICVFCIWSSCLSKYVFIYLSVLIVYFIYLSVLIDYFIYLSVLIDYSI